MNEPGEIAEEVEYSAYARYDQAWTWSGLAQDLTFRSVNKFYDANGSGRKVFIEPSSLQPIWREKPDGDMGIYLSFTLREL